MRVVVSEVLMFKNVVARGECINMKEELSLQEEIVRYASVSLSPTLSRNENFDKHIRKKTCKPNALRFWVEGCVISLYGLALV